MSGAVKGRRCNRRRQRRSDTGRFATDLGPAVGQRQSDRPGRCWPEPSRVTSVRAVDLLIGTGVGHGRDVRHLRCLPPSTRRSDSRPRRPRWRRPRSAYVPSPGTSDGHRQAPPCPAPGRSPAPGRPGHCRRARRKRQLIGGQPVAGVGDHQGVGRPPACRSPSGWRLDTRTTVTRLITGHRQRALIHRVNTSGSACDVASTVTSYVPETNKVQADHCRKLHRLRGAGSQRDAAGREGARRPRQIRSPSGRRCRPRGPGWSPSTSQVAD